MHDAVERQLGGQQYDPSSTSTGRLTASAAK